MTRRTLLLRTVVTCVVLSLIGATSVWYVAREERRRLCAVNYPTAVATVFTTVGSALPDDMPALMTTEARLLRNLATVDRSNAQYYLDSANDLDLAVKADNAELAFSTATEVMQRLNLTQKGCPRVGK